VNKKDGRLGVVEGEPPLEVELRELAPAEPVAAGSTRRQSTTARAGVPYARGVASCRGAGRFLRQHPHLVDDRLEDIGALLDRHYFLRSPRIS
jgi:hypothetical protein